MSDQKPLDVLGVGCNSVDFVYRLPAAPRADSPTAKMRISSHMVMYGGQTATTMAACASLGLRAGYLGAIGGDENGQRVKAELAAARRRRLTGVDAQRPESVCRDRRRQPDRRADCVVGP